MLANNFEKPPRRVLGENQSVKIMSVAAIVELVCGALIFINGVVYLHRSLHPELDVNKEKDTDSSMRGYKSPDPVPDPVYPGFVQYGVGCILLGFVSMVGGGFGIGGSLLGNKCMVFTHLAISLAVACKCGQVLIATAVKIDSFLMKMDRGPWTDRAAGAGLFIVSEPNPPTEPPKYGEHLQQKEETWKLAIPPAVLILAFILEVSAILSSIVVSYLAAELIVSPPTVVPCIAVPPTAHPPCSVQSMPCSGAPMPPPKSMTPSSARKPKPSQGAEVRIRVREDPASNTGSGSA